ncbi:MAG: Bax inhibitor-1 family protein [Promethearchaeati archaeon SRVP18_Atabeyarchaeia-1]
MEDNTIKYKVMPTLVWLILLMFAGAKLVSLAIEGAFGFHLAQLTISFFMDPISLIVVIVLYFVFFLLAYLTVSRTALSIVFASLFAIVCGAGLFSTTFYIADIVGADIVPEALLLTTGVFVIAMLWEWITKKDLVSWGFWLFLFLLAAIVLTIAEVFIPLTIFRVAVDLGVVLLFAIIVAYDTYWARQHAPDDRWMMAALKFFIDFINILIRIILLLIETRRR